MIHRCYRILDDRKGLISIIQKLVSKTMEVVVRDYKIRAFLIGAILSSVNTRFVAIIGVSGNEREKNVAGHKKGLLSLPLPQSFLSLSKSLTKI